MEFWDTKDIRQLLLSKKFSFKGKENKTIGFDMSSVTFYTDISDSNEYSDE